MAAPRITLRIVLDHIQSMKHDLSQQIQEVDRRLTGRIDRLEANLTRQIDGIDKRLDAIEIEELTKRVAELEARRN